MAVILLFLSLCSVHITQQLSLSDENTCKTDKGVECCYGYILSQDRTRCEECPAGFYGNDCLYECPPGQYGVRCLFRCNCDYSQKCDKAVGCLPRKSPRKSPLLRTIDHREMSTVNTIHRRSTAETTSKATISAKKTMTQQEHSKNEETFVFYAIYSFIGFVIAFILVSSIVAIICLRKQSKSTLLQPILADEHMYDDIGSDPGTLHPPIRKSDLSKRPILPSPMVNTVNGPQQWKNMVLVMNSGQTSPITPDYYSGGKEYDYAYQCEGYLNPYDQLHSSENADHFYNELTK